MTVVHMGTVQMSPLVNSREITVWNESQQISLVHRGHKLSRQFATEPRWIQPKCQLTSTAMLGIGRTSAYMT